MRRLIRKLWDLYGQVARGYGLLKAVLGALGVKGAAVAILTAAGASAWAFLAAVPAPFIVIAAAAAFALVFLLWAPFEERILAWRNRADGVQLASAPASAGVKRTIAVFVVLLVCLGVVGGYRFGYIGPRYRRDKPIVVPSASISTSRQYGEGAPERSQSAAPAKEQRRAKPKGISGSGRGISVGVDSVALGRVPEGSRIGDRSVVVGPTDVNGNTLLNRGGLAIGTDAKADETSIAVGARSGAGASARPTFVSLAPGAVASFGQQGGITAGQVNLFAADQAPITLTYSQKIQPGGPPYSSVVTINTSGRIDSATLALIFDADVTFVSHNLRACMACGAGTLNNEIGQPDNKSVWLFWAVPPFLPERPLSVLVSSATSAKLLRVIKGPPLPM